MWNNFHATYFSETIWQAAKILARILSLYIFLAAVEAIVDIIKSKPMYRVPCVWMLV